MGNANSSFEEPGFPGYEVFDTYNPCGSITDADQSPKPKNGTYFDEQQLFNESEYQGFGRNVDDRDERPTSGSRSKPNPTSVLFARALVNEVTNNPLSMRPAAMADREKRLLMAQKAANKASANGEASKVVGIPGGVGEPSVIGSITHALTGQTGTLPGIGTNTASILPPNSISQSRAQMNASSPKGAPGKYTITLGISLSRRSAVGHRDTITRQTAFDFNELQDREYKYVSSTDTTGWRAGGGEPGNATVSSPPLQGKPVPAESPRGGAEAYKIPSPDVVHIPIIQIDAGSAEAIDMIIAALARGELFIPHMSVIPEALSVDGVSPPDLVVRFGTERNEDLPPDQWPNWCLEFMHNQLYEYFRNMGARWGKRPFSITLAKKVRWKTVKHMNKYFSHAESVIDAWREKGPQYLDPQLAYIEGGSPPEEVARPHGIYLFRNGVPTNYFAPNFDPPYTTNMTRNLLLNVLNKSWDKKHREWTSEPMPRLVTPAMLVTAMCGCSDNMAGGYMANAVTVSSSAEMSALPDRASIRSSSRSTDPKKTQGIEEETSQPKSSREHGPVAATSKDPLRQDVGVGEVAKDERAQSRDMLGNITSKRELERISHGSGEERKTMYGNESRKAATPYKDLKNELEHFISSHHSEKISKKEKVQLKSSGELEAQYETPKPMSATTTHMSQSSRTGTDATMKHTNVGSTRELPEHDLENDTEAKRKKKGAPLSTLASDEDWLDDFGKPMDNQRPYEAPLAQSASSELSTGDSYSLVFEDPSGDMSEATATDSTDAERRDPISEAFETKNPLTSVSGNEINDFETRQDSTERPAKPIKKLSDPPFRSEREEPEANQENRRGSKRITENRLADPGGSRKGHPEVLRNNSALSLEYSMDSSHLGDRSSFTNQSNQLGQNRASPDTNCPFIQKPTKNLLTTITHESIDEEVVATDSDDSSETVPSDKELFNVGWAKALDPESGSHYYFTLDRSKIVWDNPLRPIQTGPSLDSVDSSPLQS
eukprot:scaffold1034_cov127-Cylindrotheca_fusiformis.AAC.40